MHRAGTRGGVLISRPTRTEPVAWRRAAVAAAGPGLLGIATVAHIFLAGALAVAVGAGVATIVFEVRSRRLPAPP